MNEVENFVQGNASHSRQGPLLCLSIEDQIYLRNVDLMSDPKYIAKRERTSFVEKDAEIDQLRIVQADTNVEKLNTTTALPDTDIGIKLDNGAEALESVAIQQIESPQERGDNIACQSLTRQSHFRTQPLLDDRYEVLEYIGSGGMGTVWKVRDKVLRDTLAIKVLHKALLGSEGAERRFKNEVLLASELTHPNIAAIFGSGNDAQGQPYIVMHYAKGETLASILSREGKLEPERAEDIFRQVFEALEHSHMKGIIHRDIKPSNIIIDKTASGADLVQIVDFGIAKCLHSWSVNSEPLTKTSEVLGSPLYMSPEQLLGMAVEPSSDFYSLGCVFYEMLAGNPPFTEENPVNLVLQHLHEQPDLTQVPKQYRAILSACLLKNPFERSSLVKANLSEATTSFLHRLVPLLAMLAAFPAILLQSMLVPLYFDHGNTFSFEIGLFLIFQALLLTVLCVQRTKVTSVPRFLIDLEFSTFLGLLFSLFLVLSAVLFGQLIQSASLLFICLIPALSFILLTKESYATSFDGIVRSWKVPKVATKVALPLALTSISLTCAYGIATAGIQSIVLHTVLPALLLASITSYILAKKQTANFWGGKTFKMSWLHFLAVVASIVLAVPLSFIVPLNDQQLLNAGERKYYKMSNDRSLEEASILPLNRAGNLERLAALESNFDQSTPLYRSIAIRLNNSLTTSDKWVMERARFALLRALDPTSESVEFNRTKDQIISLVTQVCTEESKLPPLLRRNSSLVAADIQYQAAWLMDKREVDAASQILNTSKVLWSSFGINDKHRLESLLEKIEYKLRQ